MTIGVNIVMHGYYNVTSLGDMFRMEDIHIDIEVAERNHPERFIKTNRIIHYVYIYVYAKSLGFLKFNINEKMGENRNQTKFRMMFMNFTYDNLIHNVKEFVK